ncbi:MAG TPA: hypothetical protein VMT29_17750 [Steroidobacteraceae bacterium]|nr:hypothetical protein [Steroidobacteraceae bacterium]
MTANGLVGLLGALAFVLALLTLAFAWRGRAWSGRTNSLLLSAAIAVGTFHYVLARPRTVLLDEVAAVLSFLLMTVVFWRLIRGQQG